MSKPPIKHHHVRHLADMFSFTTQYVKMVIRGKRNNKAIIHAYQTLVEEERKSLERAKKQIQKVKSHPIKAA
jgi:hypothetical protein